MPIIAITAEYNPFHKGHAYQIGRIHDLYPDAPIVAVMSGSVVQRGQLAFFDKWQRTRLALLGGVDLVLELPAVYSLQSAQNFAKGAVETLMATGLVNTLSFGCETDNPLLLLAMAQEYIPAPKWQKALASGLSFAAAARLLYGKRNPAYLTLLDGSNNLLAFEYAKAAKQYKNLALLPIRRQGSAYNDRNVAEYLPSGSALRQELAEHGYTTKAEAGLVTGTASCITEYMEEKDTAKEQERLSLLLTYFLETHSLEELATYSLAAEGEEGLLWKHRDVQGLEELAAHCATKRYSPSHLRRILLQLILSNPACSFRQVAQNPPAYLRILGFTSKGRELVKHMKTTATLPLLTNINKDTIEKAPTETFRNLLALDLRATDLQELVTTGKVTHKDYMEKPVIVD